MCSILTKYQHHHWVQPTGNFPSGIAVFGEGQQHRAHPDWRCWKGLLAAPWKGRKQQDFWWKRGHTHPLGKGFTMDCWICPQLTKEDNSPWASSPELVIKRGERKTPTWNFTDFKWINKRNDKAALKPWSGNSKRVSGLKKSNVQCLHSWDKRKPSAALAWLPVGFLKGVNLGCTWKFCPGLSLPRLHQEGSVPPRITHWPQPAPHLHLGLSLGFSGLIFIFW